MAAEGSLKIRLQLSAWEQAYGLRGPFRRVRQKIPFWLKPFWLKFSAQASVLLAFSVAGASFGLETFEPGGPNVCLDLAREPLNPRLFVPAP